MEFFCRTVNKSVGTGMDTLMSVSDGLGPSIFCRKMEKARPMREEMDGKVVYFPPESALLPLMLYFSAALFPICTLTWRVNNYVSRQEKNINRRNESTTSELFRTFRANNSESFLKAIQNLFENS